MIQSGWWACVRFVTTLVLWCSSSHSGSLALNNRRNEHLVREHGHIRNSDRMLDEQINIAIETKEHLYAQRNNLQSISKRINQLTSAFCVFLF
jgi:Golgi SNAP receptor complex protein 1